jgi:hypothetical protein
MSNGGNAITSGIQWVTNLGNWQPQATVINAAGGTFFIYFYYQ